MIAGGAGSSFTLLVTNDGNVTLSDAVVTDDMVDARLTVLSVAVTTASAAGGETCAAPSQVVSCTIPTLAVGESVTITVTFEVDSSEPEALDVPNMAEVAGEAPQGDPGDPGDDITDEDDDTINILVDIDLSIVKTFDPTAVPQGTFQSFTIVVSNDGPSDAVDVSVTDTVHDSLAVTDVAVTSGDGDCTASVGQEVDCTVQIPAEQSVLVPDGSSALRNFEWIRVPARVRQRLGPRGYRQRRRLPRWCADHAG